VSVHRRLSSVDEALAWVDAAIRPLEAEDTPLQQAIGRVLSREIRALRPIPARDCAALDGFAVTADQTVGASSYNPLSLPCVELAAGEELPDGADAVVPLEHGEREGASAIVVEAWAAGSNVDRRGAAAAAGAALVSAGTMLEPRHFGVLAAAGFARLPVVRRPRVGLLLSGVPRAGAADSNGPMLHALIERDGGALVEQSTIERSRSALADALTATKADIVVVVGGTGPGRGDQSAAALAAAGEVAVHGIALSPGETGGLGRNTTGVPVLLLPGSPAGCLVCYEMFAGRAIRRLGGGDPRLPYRSCQLTTARKIVSAIGMTEIVPVRRGADNSVEPIGSFSELGVVAIANADGFVVIPDASEGYPPGASVEVRLYDDRLRDR